MKKKDLFAGPEASEDSAEFLVPMEEIPNGGQAKARRRFLDLRGIFI